VYQPGFPFSNSDIEQKLRALINPNGDMSGGWISEVYDTYFIYSKGEQYWKQAYQIDAAENAALSGNPMEVKRVISFEVITNSVQENIMDKKQKVDAVLAGNKSFVEGDRQWLESQTEEILGKLIPVKNEEVVVVTEPEVKGEKAPVTEPAPAQNEAPKTAEEYLATAPAEVREVFQESLQALATNKAELVTKITANTRNTFTKDQLGVMSVNQLKAIAALAEVPAPEAAPRQFNFGGMAPVANASASNKEEALVAPTLNFEVAAK